MAELKEKAVKGSEIHITEINGLWHLEVINKGEKTYEMDVADINSFLPTLLAESHITVPIIIRSRNV